MKMKKIIPLFLATSMLLASCSSNDATVEEEVFTAVKVTKADSNGISKSVTYSGKITAQDTITVISKLSGKVTDTYKEIGDTVTAGETLFRIDGSDIQIAVDQASAQAKAANLAVQSAQNSKNNITGAQYEQNMLSLETSISNLKTSITTATDAMNLSKTAYENNKKLYDAGALNKVTLDQSELSYNNAKAQVDTLNLQLAQAEQSYELTKNNLIAESQKTAGLGVEQAQAAANTANLAVSSAAKNLNEVAPTAPISGIVSAKGAKVGEMISPSIPAYTISNIDNVVASVKVSENVINTLSLGDTVDVKINSLDKALKGTITEINPVADQTSTYPVKITIENPDHVIKPGMFCEVSIITETAPKAISLPRQAILRNMNTQYVYIVENGVASIKEVTTGIDTGENIEITSGLSIGDSVITEGQTYVSDGETVNVLGQ